MYYKNISYTISHIFVVLFMYLFIAPRYSKPKTAAICTAMFFAITAPNVLKLNLFPNSRLCYLIVTVYQIVMTQMTGLIISIKRDSKALFVGLSASNYVIAGSIMATIIYIYTGNLLLCTAKLHPDSHRPHVPPVCQAAGDLGADPEEGGDE